MHEWAKDTLAFWFDHVGAERWFAPTAALDREITDRFEPLWEALRDEKAIFFIDDAHAALAAIILFDQFPRNMFRHEADAFASDALALSIARLAIDAGLDSHLDAAERQFLYMPFMHSEDIADQETSLALFEGLGNEEALRFARLHHEMIARFGRFPHRNEILGRPMREGEAEAAAIGEDW